MRWKRIAATIIALNTSTASHVLANEWEVWVADQANSADISVSHPAGTFGSRILVYEGRDIMAAPPGTYGEDHPSFGPTVLEAADIFPNALAELGVNVERLHGMMPHPSQPRFINANFFGPGAGMVGIVDARGQCGPSGARTCGPIRSGPGEAAKLGEALFRTTGPAGSAPSNHMSFWTPDGTRLIIANLAAKLLERIDYDARTGVFTFNKGATLDLVGGRDLTALEAQADSTLPAGRVTGEYANFQTRYTPSGALKEGPGRPNNVVVCPIPSSNNRHVYATFGGGGLLVVDLTTEPMSIVAEYTNDVISAAGCGGAEAGGFMHLNAGVSASGAGADDSTFILYRLPLDYPDGTAPYTVPNEPPVVKFFEEKTLGITSEAQLADRRDAHGLDASPDERHLYQFDRVQNNAEVFDVNRILNEPAATLSEQAQAHVGTLDLTGSGYCVGEGRPFVDINGEGYEFDDDPAPDHAEFTPDGRRIIVSLRGPHPVTVKHAAVGSCPGFGVFTLEDDRVTGALTHVFRTFLADATGTRNLSDIHAAVVRLKGKPEPVAGMLPDRWLQVGTELEVPVGAAFADPDGDALSYRAASSGPEVVAVHTTGALVTLTAVSVGVAAVQVTATDSAGMSASRSFVVTVTETATTSFTDHPIRPGVTPVKTVHFTELRSRTDAVRIARSLPPFLWTDPVLTPRATPVRLLHVLELRRALAEAYAAAERPYPPWTDASPVRGTTAIRAVHLMELRAAVVALE